MIFTTDFDICCRLEIMFLEFRRLHGIGNGPAHRQKFLRIIAKIFDEAMDEEERRKIKIVYS
jgi:hypothetical protein